jgi:hypothetical protein
MADKYRVFSENDLAFMIVCTVLNKYDFYIILDGNRGVGKSSLAYRLAKRTSTIFKRLYRGDTNTIFEIYRTLKTKRKDLNLEMFLDQIIKLKQNKSYVFNPQDDLIYDQASAKSFLQGWNSIGVFDEFINIGFSRDFFDKGQKDLIKMINLNRDHSHIILACVPHFSTIDNQLRNLSKMRIFLKERGVGIIMQPNKAMVIRDKWDMDHNEKIERKWVESKVKHPRWGKLTTFRGIMKTKPLNEKDEEVYQKIKDEKRAVIVKEQMDVKSPQEKTREQYSNIVERLRTFKIKSFDEINGFAQGMGITPETLRNNIKKILKEDGQSTKIDTYFFDEKTARERVRQRKSQVLIQDFNDLEDDIMNL